MDNYSILNDIASIKSQPSRIMAMGVGGAGGNAIEHMWEMQIEGVNLTACNTDKDDLDKLHISSENKILLGKGIGAGNISDVGANEAIASIDAVRDLLIARGTEMLFITAGMGGGTGTGAAPVIAELAQGMDILTVAIVTMPPSNDGPHRMSQANAGVEKLRKHVDAIIILSNDAINQLYGHLPATTAFGRANDVVAFAAKGIAEIITHKTNLVNVDFADVCTVMRDSGSAIMGVASESGDDRADKVVDKILESPLFGGVSISGARNVLVNISVSSSDGLTLNEAHRVRDRVQHHAKTEDESGNIRLTNIIWGVSLKPNLAEDEIEVVIVATGFSNDVTGGTIVVKGGGSDEPTTPIQTEQPVAPQPTTVGGEEGVEAPKPREVAVQPVPKSRVAPSPLPRPMHNFTEIEECKRTPAFLTHGRVLTTATKTHMVSGVEKEQTPTNIDQPALF